MTCIAAVGGIATTYATATLATGVASVVFATSAAYAATYTPDQVTGDNAQTLESGDVIQLTQGAGIGAPGSPATLHFAEDNTGVTLDVTDNSNSTWNVSSIDNNAGISIVNIGRGGLLNVYNNTHEITYCAFNKKSEATLTITLGESATLNSVAPIFGWSAGQLPNPGKRTLTMGTDSTWNISLTGGESQEWLNNTDVNMSGASIALAAGKTLTFERAENSITTSSEAVKMSTIHGEGSLMVGGSSPILTTINGHDGILFTINRGAFDFDADNTADLQISASLANGSYKGGLLKAGDGTMELTNANSSYSNAVYVTAGTLKLSGAGTAGTGALTVDSGATLELAHTQATSIRSNITLSEGATLKASGQSTLSGTSSLLGTIVLDGTSLANTGTITLGATTSFDVRALTPTNGYIVLISGGSVSGYESVSNFTGWDGDAVLSLVSGKLLLSNAALMSSDVYWNSTDSTWSEGTTYRDSSGNTVTAGVLDNIIFEGVKTTLSLGSNIGNAVELTDNTDLTLTLGQYVLQGPVDIAEGSTLTLADPFTGPQGADMLNIGNDAWTGTGRLNLTFRNTNDANHNIKLNLSSFNGEVSISGKFNLGQSVVGADARYILNNVNIWSGGNATIANDIEVGENVVFRPTGTYTFTGTVTGKEATVGTEARVVFSNAASSIDDVYVESGRSVTYNGTATGNATLFTGDTHVAAGGSITLNPSGTDNATTVGEARQYSGAIYLNGTADSVASLTYYDGSMNITEGLHIGETSDSGKAGSITVSWDKCQYVKGLYGKDATLTIDRNHDENYGNDGHDRYIVLTGTGDFTGTLNLDNSLAAENDHNFGIMVLGEDNSAHALEGAVANFVDADSKSALIFTSSDSVISKAQFTGDSFQTDYAANATLAGLNGSNGTVYAKELTLSGSGNYSYSGGLEVAKLIVNIQGGGYSGTHR